MPAAWFGGIEQRGRIRTMLTIGIILRKGGEAVLTIVKVTVLTLALAVILAVVLIASVAKQIFFATYPR